MKPMSILMGVVILAMVSTSDLVAQDRAVRLGVMVGANSATLGGDDIDGAESKIGLLLGGYLSLGLSRNLAIETGAHFSQRGAKDTEQGVTAKINLNYIEVPALLAARFPGSSSVTPFIGVGPAVAFKVGCSISVSGGGGSASSGCSDVEDELGIDLKGMDTGLVGALGVDVKAFRVALRYFLGLSTIDGADPASSIKNRVISLVVGYGFALR